MSAGRAGPTRWGSWGPSPIGAIVNAARAGLAGDRAGRRIRVRSMTSGRSLERGRPDAGPAAGPSRGSPVGFARRGRSSALPRPAGPVSQVRESDGLEPILRLGALWQRVGAEPLRQTQQGTLYKRDRDRLAEDPVLAGPIADAPEAAARPRRALAGAGLAGRADRAGPPPASGSSRPRRSSGPTTRSTCRR